MGQSVITCISGREGQIDLQFGGKHRLMIVKINTHNFIKIEDGHVHFSLI